VIDLEAITQRITQRQAVDFDDAQQLIDEVHRLRTALNTIGTTIYTQGRGTKVEQRLLAFIRKQLGRA